jgi:hypothetical protein
MMYHNTEYRQNIFRVSNIPHLQRLIPYNRPEYSFREFYSENLFRKIKEYIGKPQSTYRTLSLGLYPAIPQYNGFYTLDGYESNYPVEYKHKFREIIRNELEKSEVFREFFDEWGSQCYVFSHELEKEGDYPYYFPKTSQKKLYDLHINVKPLQEFGEVYVFSSLEIVNYKSNGLLFLKSFENVESPLKIYLYKVE